MTNPFETLRDMGDKAPLFYAITTGAGAGLQKLIWDIPGVSNFFVGASMPYATEETTDILGFTPEKFVSEETAVDLAMAAYMRAWKPGRKAIGLGMTCSVASTKAHRGDHRVIVAIFSDDSCWTLAAIIPKGEGVKQRATDGALADFLATELLKQFLTGDIKGWTSGRDDCQITLLADFVTRGLAHDRLFAHPFFRADGSRGPLTDIEPMKTVFYPGAFNPPHKGHFDSALASQETLAVSGRQSRRVVFSTTVNPRHKPALTTSAVLQRAKLMKGHDFLITEGDPLYIDKARKFPGAHFIMGADAMDRMLDPKWGEPVRPMLSEFGALETRFLVPGRLVQLPLCNEFMTCGNVMGKHMEEVLGKSLLFIPVNFRLDLSSTEIRTKAS